jgi:hypothetical protein
LRRLILLGVVSDENEIGWETGSYIVHVGRRNVPINPGPIHPRLSPIVPVMDRSSWGKVGMKKSRIGGHISACSTTGTSVRSSEGKMLGNR